MKNKRRRKLKSKYKRANVCKRIYFFISTKSKIFTMIINYFSTSKVEYTIKQPFILNKKPFLVY